VFCGRAFYHPAVLFSASHYACFHDQISSIHKLTGHWKVACTDTCKRHANSYWLASVDGRLSTGWAKKTGYF